MENLAKRVSDSAAAGVQLLGKTHWRMPQLVGPSDSADNRGVYRRFIPQMSTGLPTGAYNRTMRPWLINSGIIAVVIIVVGTVALMIWARRAPRPGNLGLNADGQLAALPDSPNAVSTQTDDTDRRMDPLVYRADVDTTRAELVELLRNMPGTTIVTNDPHYVHVEFHTSIIGYIDDIEFAFDDEARVVHYRSASRLGHSDLGANRKRMARVQELWKATP